MMNPNMISHREQFNVGTIFFNWTPHASQKLATYVISSTGIYKTRQLSPQQSRWTNSPVAYLKRVFVILGRNALNAEPGIPPRGYNHIQTLQLTKWSPHNVMGTCAGTSQKLFLWSHFNLIRMSQGTPLEHPMNILGLWGNIPGKFFRRSHGMSSGQFWTSGEDRFYGLIYFCHKRSQ